MIKNNISDIFAVFLVLVFVACGDDSGSNAPNEEGRSDANSSVSATFTYKTYEGLASERPCGQPLNMVVAHVSSTNQDYICCYDAALKEGAWRPYLDGKCSDKESDFSKVSSSSKLPTSSSVIKSSSSMFISSSSDVHKNDVESFVDSRSSSSFAIVSRSSSSSYNPILTDSRDGQSYKVVKIGKQVWMAQNLNFETEESYCYDDDEANCSKYGRLYTWASAMDGEGLFSGNAVGCSDGKKCSPTYPVRGVCPMGWHLPSRDEWETLLKFVGEDNAVTLLRAKVGWEGDGTDRYGFSALPAGGKVDYGVYLGLGKMTCFWSSSEKYSNSADTFTLHSVAIVIDDGKFAGYSVRCVMD